jgi:hypothetical protein
MRSYGQEWQTSDVEAMGELIQWLRDKKTEEGFEILGQWMIPYDAERHWMLECEDIKPHVHLYLKWSA